MSRAFVRESDQDTESLPERVISPHPNFVTSAGLRQIEEQIREFEAARRAAREQDDKAALARIERDLRYWTQRRVSARVVEPTATPDVVRFGVKVMLESADGSRREFRVVGEDEAEPPQGRISWVSPLAAALIGKKVGDVVSFQGQDAEIVHLEA
ncbi:MAG TPA: transcription elongation factor GreA [Steroidobacteraceae bacterium]|nr:transcription elongation factor GreA [Steroidobacteraceae bacterium]